MEKVKKEHKEKIMEMIRKAGSEEYETSWDGEGIGRSKKKSNVKKGRLSRAQGGRFELKVRGDLESKKWIIDKWSNNVDLDEKKLIKAKRKYNPFSKVLVIGTGFPDFIGFKLSGKKSYEIIGIEVKMNGILSKIEKEKCIWYLENKIFSRIIIAKKAEKRGEIEYIDFKKKYIEKKKKV